MKRKIVYFVLIASLSFSIGCHSTTPIMKEELNATVEQDITVTTKDSLQYRFYNGDYSVQGDSLSGTGIQMIDGRLTYMRFHGSLPLSEITTLTAEKFSAGKTTAAILIPLAVAVGFLVWLGNQMAAGY